MNIGLSNGSSLNAGTFIVPQCETGPQGPQGETDATGPQGVSITSLQLWR